MRSETSEIHHWEEPRASQASRAVSRKSESHMVVSFTYGEEHDGIGQILSCESLLEYKVAMCLIYRPEFRAIREQPPAVLWRDATGKQRRHTLDFICDDTTERIAVVVKAYRTAIKPDFQCDMQWLRVAVVPRLADRMVVVTERHVDPVALDNAKLMHAARFPDHVVDQTLQARIAGLEGSIAIGTLATQIATDGSGYFAIVRAIRRGELICPVGVRISTETRVCRPGFGEGDV